MRTLCMIYEAKAWKEIFMVDIRFDLTISLALKVPWVRPFHYSHIYRANEIGLVEYKIIVVSLKKKESTVEEGMLVIDIKVMH